MPTSVPPGLPFRNEPGNSCGRLPGSPPGALVAPDEVIHQHGEEAGQAQLEFFFGVQLHGGLGGALLVDEIDNLFLKIWNPRTLSCSGMPSSKRARPKAS